MTFRARIAVSAAAAVALTVVAASILLYLVAREQIRAPVDEALEARAAQISLQQLAVIPGQGGSDYLACSPSSVRRADTCSSYARTDPSSCLPGRSSSSPSVSACSRWPETKARHSGRT